MKCQICGKKATGAHYGVPSCEGCKAFYRRGMQKKLTFTCLYQNNCVIKPGAKGCCKACRFKKCKTLGMNIHGLNYEVKYANTAIPSHKRSTHAAPRDEISAPSIPSSSLVQFEHAASSPVQWDFSETSRYPPLSPYTVNGDLENAYSVIQFSPMSTTAQQHDNGQNTRHDFLIAPNVRYHSPHPETMMRCNGFFESSMRFSVDTPLHDMFTGAESPNLWPQSNSLAMTAQSVAAAVGIVFGDQISRWNLFKDRAQHHGEIPHQPETTMETLLEANTYHNADNIERIKKFAGMLPGVADLNLFATSSITTGWKWVVFWMIHHAAYFTRTQSYFTVGPQQYHYCRYWQDLIHDWPLTIFIYKFCGDFEDIGLSQMEKYLLIAVVMFEPDCGVPDRNVDNGLKLQSLHKHYTDVLFDMIKRRAGDRQLTYICKRLEQFFGALKRVYNLHRNYNRAHWRTAVSLYDAATHSGKSIWWKAKHEFIQ